MAEPKVLVISNNAFSACNNNGKTLASFFDNFSPGNIAQLYFSAESPTGTLVHNFYQITDADVIRSIINKNYPCGRKIVKLTCKDFGGEKSGRGRFAERAKSSNSARLVRELFWNLGRWESDELLGWLDGIAPEVIFFCAGDSGFAYDVTRSIQRRFRSKLVVYITDDYVLPRRTANLMWWIRRFFICSKMKAVVSSSDLFVTISAKMKRAYQELLGKESMVLVNMTPSLRLECSEKGPTPEITLVYAGGLHLKRFETLNLLADSIRRYNDVPSNEQKAYLRIFSNQTPDESILRKINIAGASEYCGTLDSDRLKEVLNCCDIPVHVESFDRKSMASTMLSISTKIPEYLSLGKPVLAIGPKEVASMEYLADTAFCVTSPTELPRALAQLIKDKKGQLEMAKRALAKFEKNHRKEVLGEQFKKNICGLV